MSELDFLVFAGLFKEAYLKCFGRVIEGPMTETESKLFCNKILDQTGLSIGWKSVKNYSFFVIDPAGKEQNPSVATLDTMARYVLAAPYTNEIQRKNEESHYPYWFIYREKFQKPTKKRLPKKRLIGAGIILTVIIIAVLIGVIKFLANPQTNQFIDYFKHTDDNSMLANGWFVKAKNQQYWDKRNEKPGRLTLYTLKGDNWPDPSSKPNIENLLLRPITTNCFTAEVHLANFIPRQEWQQAGILLLEDTTFTGKSIRLSLAYNDYFGGMKRPREILVQAITSLGNGFGKPEEIAHKIVVFPDSAANNPALMNILDNTSLRIEKRGNKYRFLYAGGTRENGAFKEVVTQEFNMRPKYIGLFAIKGFTNSDNMPVGFKFFRITGDACSE